MTLTQPTEFQRPEGIRHLLKPGMGLPEDRSRRLLDQAGRPTTRRSDELRPRCGEPVHACPLHVAPGFCNSASRHAILIVVTALFGMRVHPVLGIMKRTLGTDMAADCGTIIHAVASRLRERCAWMCRRVTAWMSTTALSAATCHYGVLWHMVVQYVSLTARNVGDALAR